MNLGHTIANLREKKGLKQGEFAQILDVTPGYLSQIENNHRIPNSTLLEKISDKLSISLPLIFVLSMDEKDVPVEKQSHFAIIGPLLKNFVKELIEER